MTDWFGGKRVGNLQQELNRVFTDFGFTPPQGLGSAFSGLSSQPRVEVEKTKTGYEIEITLPFPVEAGRIEAEVREGRLVITADRPPETSGTRVDIRTGAAGASGGDAQPRPGGTGASDAAHGGAGSTQFSGHGSDAPSGMMGQGGQSSSGEGMMGEGV